MNIHQATRPAHWIVGSGPFRAPPSPPPLHLPHPACIVCSVSSPLLSLSTQADIRATETVRTAAAAGTVQRRRVFRSVGWELPGSDVGSVSFTTSHRGLGEVGVGQKRRRLSCLPAICFARRVDGSQEEAEGAHGLRQLTETWTCTRFRPAAAHDRGGDNRTAVFEAGMRCGAPGKGCSAVRSTRLRAVRRRVLEDPHGWKRSTLSLK